MIVNFIKKSGFDKICMRFVAHYSEQQYEKTICNKNNITINDGDIRVILYKGADIIGYAIATNNKIRFIYSEEKTTEFKSYFEKYLNHSAAKWNKPWELIIRYNFIRLIAKVENVISKRLTIRVCEIIKITFAIALLHYQQL